MTSHRQSLVKGLTLCACTLSVLATVHADQSQDAATTQLDTLVVSATRTPQDPKTIPNSVALISLSDLETSQIVDVRTALSEVPGVYIANTGAVGSQSSIFLRGSSSTQTLLVVDGVPMNDRNNSYANFLGGADLGGVDRLEVLRGPQGTLYGSSAMGGVVLLDTAHGCGKLNGVVGAEYGSYGTVAASAAASGGTKDFGYSLSLNHQEAENDRDYNYFRQWSYSTRLEGNLSDQVLVGATFRGQDGAYEEPGSTSYKSPGFVDNHNHLVTTYLQIKPATSFTSRLTGAWERHDYIYTSAYGVSENLSVRKFADLQNTWTANDSLELVFGASGQHSDDTINSYGTLTRASDRLSSAYLSSTFKPVKELMLNAGVRYDDYRSWGDATTWRVGGAYQIKETGTTLRSTYGTAFTAPSIEDRYGVASWGQDANVNIQPEKSAGWDAGIVQTLAKNVADAEVTYFHNQYKNLIQWVYTSYVTYHGQQTNVTRATTSGVETALNLHFTPQLSSRIAYTYLDAGDETNHIRLIRRPHHVLDSELRYTVKKQFTVGTGLHFAADRLDGSSTAPKPAEDYTTVRLFGSYAVTESLTLKARIENLLNEKYSEVVGYPALGFNIHVGAEWRF